MMPARARAPSRRCGTGRVRWQRPGRPRRLASPSTTWRRSSRSSPHCGHGRSRRVNLRPSQNRPGTSPSSPACGIAENSATGRSCSRDGSRDSAVFSPSSGGERHCWNLHYRGGCGRASGVAGRRGNPPVEHHSDQGCRASRTEQAGSAGRRRVRRTPPGDDTLNQQTIPAVSATDAAENPGDQDLVVVLGAGRRGPCGSVDPLRCVGQDSASATGQDSEFSYRWRLLMYCTTPSGTRYQTGIPAATRLRQSVDEIAIAGTSIRETAPAGRWWSFSS